MSHKYTKMIREIPLVAIKARRAIIKAIWIETFSMSSCELYYCLGWSLKRWVFFFFFVSVASIETLCYGFIVLIEFRKLTMIWNIKNILIFFGAIISCTSRVKLFYAVIQSYITTSIDMFNS